ncbi:hypothetical protein Landi51_01561 [Colletotrichum acutatum]
MGHSSPDISLDIWGPPSWAKAWGIVTVALRRPGDHDGTVTVDISWTSSPAKGHHDRTRRDYDMTMDPETEKHPVVATEPPRGSEEHDPRPAPRRYPSRKSNIPPPRRGQAPPNRLPTILYPHLGPGLLVSRPLPPRLSPPSRSTGLQTLPTTTAAPGLLGPGPVALGRRG